MIAGITGNGIAKRLHEPVLSEFCSVDVREITLPDSSSKIHIQSGIEELRNLDLLIIGTPTCKHINHILFASLHCSRILCEKPVGSNLLDLRNLNTYLSAQKKCVFVNYQLRFTSQFSELLKIIEFNKNKIKKLTLEYKSGTRNSSNLPSWYYQPGRGGGIIYSILPHLLDLLLCLKFDFYKVDSVISSSKNIFIDSSDVNYNYPMDDVNICFKCYCNTAIEIIINSKEEYDCFNITLETASDVIVYDFVSGHSSKSASINFTHPLGSLSSKKPGIWRMGFKRLMETLLIQMQESSAHNVIPTVEYSLKIQEIILEIITYNS
jgi:predicted dehydrogenase